MMQDDRNSGEVEGFSARFQYEARPPCQLYLISPPAIAPGFGDSLKAAAGEGGVAAFQLRLKGIGDDLVVRAATPLQRICADLGVAFIINDSISVANQIGSDGVHLGQQDGSVTAARQILGPEVQIGVTCHNSRHLAMEAGEQGADYVAFGAFFQSGTKKVSHFADPELISWWTTLFGTPCVAIGGITPENARPLVEAGADFLAVSASVWNAAHGPAAAVCAFRRLFDDRP